MSHLTCACAPDLRLLAYVSPTRLDGLGRAEAKLRVDRVRRPRHEHCCDSHEGKQKALLMSMPSEPPKFSEMKLESVTFLT